MVSGKLLKLVTVMCLVLILQGSHEKADAISEIPGPPSPEEVVSIKKLDEGDNWSLWLTVSEKWERIGSYTTQCGIGIDTTITEKIGVTETIQTQVTSTIGTQLGLSTLAAVESSISTTVGTSVSFEKETTRSIKVNIHPGATEEIDVGVFQKMRIYKFEYLNWSFFDNLFGTPNWTETFVVPRKDYNNQVRTTAIDCSTETQKDFFDQFDVKLVFDVDVSGIDEQSNVVIRDTQRTLIFTARPEGGGDLILPGFSGVFSLGDSLSYADLPAMYQLLLDPDPSEPSPVLLELASGSEYGPMEFDGQLQIEAFNGPGFQPLGIQVTDSSGLTVPDVTVELNGLERLTDDLGTLISRDFFCITSPVTVTAVASKSGFQQASMNILVETLDPPPGCSVGGVAELPEVAGTPLETDGSSGAASAGVFAGIAGAVLVGGISLGGAAWYARRRLISR